MKKVRISNLVSSCCFFILAAVTITSVTVTVTAIPQNQLVNKLSTFGKSRHNSIFLHPNVIGRLNWTKQLQQHHSLLLVSDGLRVRGGADIDVEDSDESEDGDYDEFMDAVENLIEEEDDDEEDDDEEEEQEESEEDEESEEETEDSSDEDEEEEDNVPEKAKTTGEPVIITIKSSTGSKLLDQAVELQTVSRSRNVASLKQSVSRLLPARPPIAAVQLTLHGQILSDDTLVSELLEDLEDEDEDDNEQDENTGLILTMDMVPAVDPKFMPELDKKINDMTTKELLEAYAINEAALYHNSALIMQDDNNNENELDGDSDNEGEKMYQPINPQIRQQALRIQQNIENTVLNTDRAKNMLADTIPPSSKTAPTIEVKGQRIRQPGYTGSGSWKRIAQHYLNVNWVETIRNFFLFLFFGWFGGRTATSRAILLLGAPSVFILQARPVKILLRQILYTIFDNPPSIVLSLLPAPQQTILSFNIEKAMDAIYGDRIIKPSTDHRNKDEMKNNDFVDFNDNNQEYDDDFTEYIE